MPKRRKRGRPRTGSKPVVPVRLAARQLKKIAKLAELGGVNRSTVLRRLIDIGLDSPEVSLLMHRPGAERRSAFERTIRVLVADERAKVAQAAVMRAPSVETEVNARRAQKEQEEAMAAYLQHHLTPPDLRTPDRCDIFDGVADMQRSVSGPTLRPPPD